MKFVNNVCHIEAEDYTSDSEYIHVPKDEAYVKVGANNTNTGCEKCVFLEGKIKCLDLSECNDTSLHILHPDEVDELICTNACPEIRNFHIGTLIINVSNGKKKLGKKAFYGNAQINDCTISNLIIKDGVQSIEKNFVARCEIKTLSIESKDIEIEDYAFNCSSIGTIDITSGSIKKCSDKAFYKSIKGEYKPIGEIKINALFSKTKDYIKNLAETGASLIFKVPSLIENGMVEKNIIQLTEVIEDSVSLSKKIVRSANPTYQNMIKNDDYQDYRPITLVPNYFAIVVRDYKINYYDGTVTGSEIVFVTNNKEYFPYVVHVLEPSNVVIDKLKAAKIIS